ncbi:MAG: glycosyltransferase family 4 protein [Candidatus Alcyoniella australis]|nr:glycosyltransferase family 4 protein [Candidatus Alcyoniella australis]
MKLTFISDRYPPDVVGGAEISLFHLVNELKLRPGIEPQVVALTEQHEQVVNEQIDGVPVTRVPSRYDHRFPLPRVPVVVPWARDRPTGWRGKIWRREQRILAWFDRFSPWPLKRIWPAIKAHVKYLFKRTHTSFALKLALFCTNCVAYFRSRENIECLDEDFDRIIRIDELRSTVEALEPDVVHADNQRSIMRYAELDLPFPAVAMIRDMKFVCPRRVIIGHVGERPCTECDMACLATVPRPMRPLLRKVFEHNREYRLRCLAQFSKVVTTSAFLQSLMEREAGVQAQVVPNAVGEIDKMQNAKQRMTKRSQVPTVLSVGMLQRHKGIDHAIRIMPKLRKQVPDAELVIVGRGGYEPQLRKEIELLGASAYIRFAGFLTGEDLYQAYLDADLTVCFTRWPEPFGRVPLESMFFERPVVASRQGGFLETIEHGRTGLLVEPGDEQALLDAVAELMLDSERRLKMGRAGHESVLENYSPGAVAAAWERIYAEVASGAAS